MYFILTASISMLHSYPRILHRLAIHALYVKLRYFLTVIWLLLWQTNSDRSYLESTGPELVLDYQWYHSLNWEILKSSMLYS